MPWQQILQIDPGPVQPLRQRIDVLFDQQRETWPTLRDGEAALAGFQRRTLSSAGESVVVQVNPARRRSTLAKTDAKTVAARTCFLCPENMPAEERGVAFEDFVVLPNPYPILPLHCTVACREHRPQHFAGRSDAFLRLAAALGPDLAALYNGPRCGASAPDHLHFQAARADAIPLLAQLPTNRDALPVVAHTSFGRNMLIFRDTDAAQIESAVQRSIKAMREIDAGDDEPMFNLLAHADDNGYAVVLFPRAAHRPDCYFAVGPKQLLISPAILEMCSILVTTELDHFDRVDAAIARTIYQQVSLAAAPFAQLVSQVG